MIEVRGLTKRYRGTTAVDDLSFTVGAGQVTGFIGPNGSGKSTTMRVVLDLDRPSAGEALVNGRQYAELQWPLREVGALLGSGAFHPGRSAFAHLLALAQTNAIGVPLRKLAPTDKYAQCSGWRHQPQGKAQVAAVAKGDR